MSRSWMRIIVGIAWAVNTNLFGLVWIGAGQYRAFAQDDTRLFVAANILLFLLGALIVGLIVDESVWRYGKCRVPAGLVIVLLAADLLSGLALAAIG